MENREERAFWAASLEKLADSAALNGDALNRRKIGLAWLFWISCSNTVSDRFSG